MVLANSDQLDTLGLVTHQWFLFRTRFSGISCVPRSLISDSSRPPIGDPGLASPDRRPPALGQAAQTHRRGPLSLGVAIVGLERLGIAPLDGQGRHGDWLASQGLRPVLEVENPPREAWPAGRAERDSGVDPHAEP